MPVGHVGSNIHSSYAMPNRISNYKTPSVKTTISKVHDFSKMVKNQQNHLSNQVESHKNKPTVTNKVNSYQSIQSSTNGTDFALMKAAEDFVSHISGFLLAQMYKTSKTGSEDGSNLEMFKELFFSEMGSVSPNPEITESVYQELVRGSRVNNGK